MDENKVDKNLTEENTEVKEEQETKTYTEEELQELLQKNSDKRVTEALATSKAKLEDDFNKKLEEEKERISETANMTAEEKAKADFEAEKEAWEKEIANFEKEKLELSTSKKLAEEGLPSEFSQLLLADDEESTDANIKSFKEYWKQALETAVDERLTTGSAPTVGSSKPKINMTKEEFGKLPYKERNALLDKDPNYLNKLK